MVFTCCNNVSANTHTRAERNAMCLPAVIPVRSNESECANVIWKSERPDEFRFTEANSYIMPYKNTTFNPVNTFEREAESERWRWGGCKSNCKGLNCNRTGERSARAENELSWKSHWQNTPLGGVVECYWNSCCSTKCLTNPSNSQWSTHICRRSRAPLYNRLVRPQCAQ